MPLIELSKLTFRWPGNASPTLQIDHFALQAGEHLFLHGPSGSGKSTLLALLTGIQTPQQGQVQVLGHNLATLSGPARDRLRADHIGYVFQQFNLLPYLSVLDNVLLPCRLSKVRREKAGDPQAAARALLERLDLARDLHKKAASLSVGMQQRVAVARALIGAPEILIADEPTSALDADRRQRFLDLLFECAGQTAILLVSHDPALAAAFSRTVELALINQAGREDYV